MNTLENLMHFNWFSVVLALIAAMLAFKFLSDLFGWFVTKFGLETKSMREQRENRDLIKTTAENLASLQARHTKDEKEFRENLNNYIKESRADRKALHDEMKQYSQNRISDRQQSLQIQSQLKDSIKAISNSNVENDKQIASLIVAQKEILAEKINEKYKYYLSIGGIPEDERDEFVSLHDAYNGVGGNHHGDAKFEYCMNHLPVIPVETRLVVDED